MVWSYPQKTDCKPISASDFILIRLVINLNLNLYVTAVISFVASYFYCYNKELKLRKIGITMKRNMPDLSNHEASIGLLSQIFPQLAPLSRIFSGNTVYSRKTAPLGFLLQLFIIFIAASAFMLVIFLSQKLGGMFSSAAMKNVILRIVAIIFGLPLMMTILVCLSKVFDLFYLTLSGENFDVSGGAIKSVKIVFMVMGFVGSLVFSGYVFFKYDDYANQQQKRQVLSEEQKEYFGYLNQGRDAWNKYITAGPKHNIDFSYADLSNRKFNGFFFEFVHFDCANLTKTVFEDCNLQSAYFDNANCQDASFKNSYLRMADFIDTDLKNADFSGACGEKSDFKKAKIDAEQLKDLRAPAESRWHNTTWQNFHTPEWLREKGYSF